MKISREANLALNWILNEAVPPFIRDRKWFGWLITKILYKDKAHIYMSFHDRVYDMTPEEFQQVYRDIQSTALERPTDLNQASIDKILANITGEKVLEVGCGRGYFIDLVAKKGFDVTGCDVAIAPMLKDKYPNIHFQEAAAEKLPFADKSFDTVITTHMLEHVRDLKAALAELRRVTRKRLIVVVPCERPHYYTPNLHLHFFPYKFSFLLAFQPQGKYALEKAGGDWFYYEDIQTTESNAT